MYQVILSGSTKLCKETLKNQTGFYSEMLNQLSKAWVNLTTFFCSVSVFKFQIHNELILINIINYEIPWTAKSFSRIYFYLFALRLSWHWSNRQHKEETVNMISAQTLHPIWNLNHSSFTKICGTDLPDLSFTSSILHFSSQKSRCHNIYFT